MKSSHQDPSEARHPLRLAAPSAQFLAALVGLSVAIYYDVWFWMKHRGTEVTLDGLGFATALLYVFVLALPVALVLGVLLGSVEASLRRTFGRFAVLFRPQAMLRRAPDEVADATLFLVLLAASVLVLRAIAMLALSRLHAHGLIATLVGLAAPAVLLPLGLLGKRLQRPFRAFFRQLDGAACPLLLQVILCQFAYVGRMRFAEVAPATERAMPWYIVFIFFWGGVAHLLVAGALPRSGRGGIRTRRAAGILALAAVIAIPSAIFAYGRTTAQRFLVEELSWVGSRAHRGWSELLDRDGDGQPRLLGGRDCDDSRSDVHPGAIDRPGDDVDADCFGGDGTPPFEDRADGNLALQPIPAQPLNVLLISIDTMRPDRLRAGGERRNVTPRLDALLRESVWFRHADAPSPRTIRSVPSVFSGQHPGNIHYERSLGRIDIAAENHMLAEIVSGRYDSFAVLGTSYFHEAPGLLQGFGHLVHSAQMKPAPSWVADQTIAAIDQRIDGEKPFFGWAHFFNPHEPYLVDRYPSRFGNQPSDFYDTEIWRADEQVGRILDHLREKGLLEKTVVVVFSDHGEALGEHGAWGHSTRLNSEQVASVLMVRAPGFAPRIVDTPVALFDLMPTVLDLIGTRAWRPMSARSLVPAMRGDESHIRNRPIFGEIFPDAIYAIETQSVRVGNEKLLFWPLTGRSEYFDLSRDPREQRDVRDRNRAKADRLLDILRAWDTAQHRRENRSAQLIADAIVRSVPRDVPRIDARFANGIELLGAKIHQPRVPRDGMLVIDLYFRPTQPVPSDYYIHLTFDPTDGTSFAAHFAAHHTAVDGSYPTSRWRPGEIIRDTVTIRVPASVQPGVPLTANVQLWSHFHAPSPVNVRVRGVPATTVAVGNLQVQ